MNFICDLLLRNWLPTIFALEADPNFVPSSRQSGIGRCRSNLGWRELGDWNRTSSMKIPDGGIRWSFRGPDISDEFKIGRLHQRQVGRLRIEKSSASNRKFPAGSISELSGSSWGLTRSLPPGADFGKRCESCPSSANRYYCASPLRNEAHIELLHTFERTASTRASTQNLSRFACERIRSRSDGRFLGCEGEIAKIGSLLRGAFRPEDEKLASILSGVRAVCLAGLEMQRSAGLVLLALVGEVALNHVERLSHAFVEVCRNDRAGFQSDVQHHWPQ